MVKGCAAAPSIMSQRDTKQHVETYQNGNFRKKCRLRTYKQYRSVDQLSIECVQSRGLSRRLWLSDMSGQAKAVFRPSPLARLGPAYFGLAWPGSWPGAGPGTSLHAKCKQVAQVNIRSYTHPLSGPWC